MKVLPVRSLAYYIKSSKNIVACNHNKLPCIDTSSEYYPHAWSNLFERSSVTNIISILTQNQPYGGSFIPSNPLTMFNIMKPEDINVIICGQDPYPDKEDACGIAFASKSTKRTPPSLMAMMKELIRTHPMTKEYLDRSLYGWIREQGIFLINTSLTLPIINDSSRKLGYRKDESLIEFHRVMWNPFIISVMNDIIIKSPDVVCVLLGGIARDEIGMKINSKRLITEYHPAAGCWNADNDFAGCDLFKRIDKQLALANVRVSWCTPLSLNSKMTFCRKLVYDCVNSGVSCIVADREIASEAILSKICQVGTGVCIGGYIYYNGTISNNLHCHLTDDKFKRDCHIYIITRLDHLALTA